MHTQGPVFLRRMDETKPQDLLLCLQLLRESQVDNACLSFVHASRYAALYTSPESILHPQELKYFLSLSAIKRKKDFLLGRYAAKRALLKLSPGCSASDIHIKPGVFQQPIVHGPGCELLSICITHSADIATAVAFPTGHPLGIDIEGLDSTHLPALKSHISPHELPPLEISLSELERYTRVWTIKESLSKILRCGLMTPFTIFEIKGDLASKSGVWSGGFANFPQYSFASLTSQRLAFALVHPGRTRVVVPIEKIMAFLD